MLEILYKKESIRRVFTFLALFLFFIPESCSKNSYEVSYKSRRESKFSANFESGTLGEIELLNMYDLSVSSYPYSIKYFNYVLEPPFEKNILQDNVSKPISRWYYFRMIGVKNNLIKFNFKHTDSELPFYSYDGVDFKRFSKEESGFNYFQKLFLRDTVYISYSFPYTFSHFISKAKKWSEKSNIFKVDTVGYSLGAKPILLCTLTDNSVADMNKKHVYIHCRIHPSETPSSYMVEKMIEFLLSGNKRSCEYLKNIIFHFIPMPNPDGVIAGHSRTNLLEYNLEVCFNENAVREHNEAIIIKETIANLYSKKKIDLALNIHSQVLDKENLYFRKKSEVNDFLYEQQKIFNSILGENDKFFSADKPSFSDYSTFVVEHFFYRLSNGYTLALTYELPNTYYDKRANNGERYLMNKETIEYSAEQLLRSIDIWLHLD